MLGTKVSHTPVKRCPNCNRQYDDYTLRFCLEDGSSLFTPEDIEPPPTAVMELVQAVKTTATPARVFVSYKRSLEPDEKIALQVYDALGMQHDVFIDQKIKIGTQWADCIEEELRQSHFLIVFLSAQSINSEMVWGEVKMAHQLAKEQGGRPRILPVRVNYSGPFPYPMSTVLDRIQYFDWRGPEDTDRMIEEVGSAVSGRQFRFVDRGLRAAEAAVNDVLPAPLPQAQPLCLELPEGTMDPQSQFYVSRQADAAALEVIKQPGVTMTIKGPRQMGKSSLLMRILDGARQVGKRVLFLDFQELDGEALTSADSFFRQFCWMLTERLGIADRRSEAWSNAPSGKMRCTRYVNGYILNEVSEPLVIAIDEVDTIFDAPFRSDFFSMLRYWHNSRAASQIHSDAAVWKQLDLILVTSTEPYQFIQNLNQSPFNVGLKLALDDFELDQVSELNLRHGSPLTRPEVAELRNLLGGQPYLVRRALYLVASKQDSFANLMAKAADDHGPFGDHLRSHVLRIHDRKDLVQALMEVVRRNKCPDEQMFFRLHGAGLVSRGPQKGTVVPRCPLYSAYFKEHLHG